MSDLDRDQIKCQAKICNNNRINRKRNVQINFQ